MAARSHVSHDSSLRYQPQPTKRHSLSSAAIRMHQLFGESPRSWEGRLSGQTSDYHRVARMNGVLRSLGMDKEVVELNTVIEHSLAPSVVPDIYEALSDEQVADCFEDASQEPFRERLRRGIATVEDGESYVKRSAAARHKAELAELSVKRWVEQQRGQA